MFEVDKQDSDIWGLAYLPSIVGGDDADFLGGVDHTKIPAHFSECNENTLRAVIEKIQPTVVVEIGVDRPVGSSRSSTATILDARPDGCIYIGIDKDKKKVDGPDVFFQCQKSEDIESFSEFMEANGIEHIDVLMIDGWHSVNACINDWQYTKWLSDKGAVVFHDTNFHPGPVVLFDAIDETLFDKKKHCVTKNDFGMGVAIRR